VEEAFTGLSVIDVVLMDFSPFTFGAVYRLLGIADMLFYLTKEKELGFCYFNLAFPKDKLVCRMGFLVSFFVV
jgi:hypothetical protein